MKKSKILSGAELVARGVTKFDCQLPEIGLKDELPNGSWLEQKQIQSALEARKHLIEVERIEKRGTLSQAEWHEDIKLAEVSQKVGGHWQFMGHNVGKKLFINPEEALFLMEVNGLQLKYNNVTVSLQQAYSLLLRSKITLTHYKVYSYLSRLGYKVFRYSKSIETDKHIKNASENKMELGNSSNEISYENENNRKNEISDEFDDKDVFNLANESENEIANNTSNEMSHKNEYEVKKYCDENEIEMKEVKEIDSFRNEITSDILNETSQNVNDDEIKTYCDQNKIDEIGILVREVGYDNNSIEMTTEPIADTSEVIGAILTENIPNTTNNESPMVKNYNNVQKNYQESNNIRLVCSKILSKLENRKLKPSDPHALEKHFEIVPDLYQKQKITVKAPEEQYIPKNVFLNHLSYVLNMDNIKTINHNRPTTDSRSYSMLEEVNGEHIRRIRDNLINNQFNNWIPPLQHQISRFTSANFPFRPFFQFRPRPQNFFHYNVLLQNLQNNFNFQERFRFNQGPRIPDYNQVPDLNPADNANIRNNRKRPMANKKKDMHLQAIQNLAERVKCMARVGWNSRNIDALRSLIGTFNIRYKMNIRLTDEFDIVNDENIVDTIELDCDDEPVNKKAKVDIRNKYEENFNNLKKMASKLKELEDKGNATSRCRRAFSNLLKNFNKMYSADVYIDNNSNVFDRSHITLDSSSESDCVIEEETHPKPKGKLLKNPFNILKRLSQKHNSSIDIPSTSNNQGDNEENFIENRYYKDVLSKNFSKNWLPDENDFGRAEVVSENASDSLVEAKKVEYLFEFIKNHPNDFENWLDVKLSFIRSISQSVVDYEIETVVPLEDRCTIKPIIGAEDCSDMRSVLKKLSIIPTNNDMISETSLNIDFDVYNRDVPNFRKTSPPTPHFRVICLEESSRKPSASEIAAIHSQYKDDVPLVFAIVSISSVSFLEITPTTLPVYIANNDFEFT